MLKKVLLWVFKFSCVPFFGALILLVVFYCRVFRKSEKKIVLGSTPILNYKYWAKSLKLAGYSAETYTFNFYQSINQREDWDRVLTEEYLKIPKMVKPYIAFIDSLLKYDIFLLSFDGYFLSATPMWFLEPWILKKSLKKILLFTYGGDSYVYNRIRSSSLLFGLLKSYPLSGRNQRLLSRRLDLWCAYGDIVASGVMAMDGIGRCDVPVASTLCIDANEWKKSNRLSLADGKNGVVYIAHAPNHRGFKGSEFVIDAIEKLKEKGFLIELILIENKQNNEVKKILEEKSDILVEQLVFTGHGLNGLEGMMSGLPVISNLEDENYLLPFKRWSYFEQCPLVSASPETIEYVLQKLIQNPVLRHALGDSGRAYAEKFHSLEAGAFLLGNIIESLYNKNVNLMNLFHPLVSEALSIPKRVSTIVLNDENEF